MENKSQTQSDSRIQYYEGTENRSFYAKKLYDLATEMDYPDERIYALRQLSQTGDLNQMKNYFGLYTRLNDSVILSRNLAKDQLAKIQFDTENTRSNNLKLAAENAEQKLTNER